MVSDEARREARRALERRLLQERALFAGAVAAFAAALYLDLTVSAAYDILVYALIALCGLTGAGYDGAREGLKDLELIAGLLEREGAGARITRVPFFSRGHYELWFEAPGPAGSKRFGLSFANSLLFREKRSLYVLILPLPSGKYMLGADRPRKPFTETGIGGPLEGKTVEYYLWRPSRGASPAWHLLVYASPGRPMDLGGLVELRQRAEQLAEKLVREGGDAVAWGTKEAFRKPEAAEIPPNSVARLQEPRL